jgi:UDP:flavonoid glycosyltransferase YjiC (YdhE family)
VRILFSFHEGPGHYNPLVPLAKRAVAAGHTVAFSADPKRVGLPEADGFTAFPTGIDPYGSQESVAIEERYNAASPGREREDALIRDGFAGVYPRAKAADMVRLCGEWQPDVIVWDEANLGAPIAADRLGIPNVSVLVLAAGSLLRPDLITAGLNAIRAEHGLPPDPDLTMLSRYLVLSPFPDGFRDPAFPLPPTARTIRPLLPDPAPGEALPTWAASLPDRPTVYLSLGTAFDRDLALAIFGRIIPSLAELPITLIVTVGRKIDPAELGEQPANVHVERYVSQSLLLPLVDLFVSHAGSGSVMGALSHGVPLALIPRGADQPENAARCEALRVGRIIGTPDITGEEARTAVAAMLDDPSYRARATRLRDQIATLPGVDEAFRLIERVAADRPSGTPKRQS